MAKERLTLKQEIFCQEWVDTVGNGTQAALKAFGIKGKELLEYWPETPTKEQIDERKRVENVAAVMANDTLRNTKVLKRIDELLDERGFTDETVKREHFKLIVQSEDQVKVRAIADYYKLKGKYEPERIQVESITPEQVAERIKNLKK